MNSPAWHRKLLTEKMAAAVTAHAEDTGKNGEAVVDRVLTANKSQRGVRKALNAVWSKRCERVRDYLRKKHGVASTGAFPPAVVKQTPTKLPTNAELNKPVRAATLNRFVAALNMTQRDVDGSKSVFRGATAVIPAQAYVFAVCACVRVCVMCACE